MFITWRLHGTLPRNRVFPTENQAGRAFVAMDRLLDRAEFGPRHLSRPEIANLAVDAILRSEQMEHFVLQAFSVMPNHVHLLVSPHVTLAKLTHSLKRATAKAANEILGLAGQPFWQDESYDHLVRDRAEFQRIIAYIENNPVRAGLAPTAEAYPWSSGAGSHPAGRFPTGLADW